MSQYDTQIEQYIASIFGDKKEYKIEQLITSLHRLPAALDIPMKEQVLKEAEKKLYGYRDMQTTKEKIKNIIEAVIELNVKNKVKKDIGTIMKGNNSTYGFDTSNTIIIGDKDKAEDTQCEFKSIIDDVDRGIENLEEKTKPMLSIDLGTTDTFITERKMDRQKRIEEIRQLAERRALGGNRVMVEPKIMFDDTSPWRYSPTRQDNNIEKCSQIISKIDEIISRKEKPEYRQDSSKVVKNIEKYETQFNYNIMGMIKELADQLNRIEEKKSTTEGVNENVNRDNKNLYDNCKNTDDAEENGKNTNTGKNVESRNNTPSHTPVTVQGSTNVESKGYLHGIRRILNISMYVCIGFILGICTALVLNTGTAPY